MNQHVSDVMDDLVPTFTDERGDWSDVLTRAEIGPETELRVSRLRGSQGARRLLVLIGVIVAASAAALAITAPWSGTPTLLERASAALTRKPGAVLHEQFETIETNPRSGKVTRHLTDVWNGPNGRFRAFLRPGPGGTLDEVGSMSSSGRILRFDPGTNTITDAGFFFRFGDPVAYIKKALSDGNARDIGRTTIAGRIVEEIRDAPANSDNSRIFIDPRTYDPVEATAIEEINGVREPTVIKFLIYQQLPATPANLRLADIKAEHPHAKLIP
jgi:hypothetical protein